MADRFTDLERRVKALENKIFTTPPAAPASKAPALNSSDFLWQLIGSRLEMHGRRIDIDHAISQVRSHVNDDAIIRIFARPFSVK